MNLFVLVLYSTLCKLSCLMEAEAIIGKEGFRRQNGAAQVNVRNSY